MAYIGAVLVIGLTACGAPDDTSTGATSATAAGASPPVIQVDGMPGGSAQDSDRSAAPMAVSDEAASAESTKMMPSLITYVYDGEITDLTAPSASWFFESGVAPTAEQIAALAAALGVEGEARELPADMGGGWMVGPDDLRAADGQRRRRRDAELVVQPRQRGDVVASVRAVPARRSCR